MLAAQDPRAAELRNMRVCRRPLLEGVSTKKSQHVFCTRWMVSPRISCTFPRRCGLESVGAADDRRAGDRRGSIWLICGCSRNEGPGGVAGGGPPLVDVHGDDACDHVGRLRVTRACCIKQHTQAGHLCRTKLDRSSDHRALSAPPQRPSANWRRNTTDASDRGSSRRKLTRHDALTSLAADLATSLVCQICSILVSPQIHAVEPCAVRWCSAHTCQMLSTRYQLYHQSLRCIGSTALGITAECLQPDDFTERVRALAAANLLLRPRARHPFIG